jgi:hypothetical protein
MGMDEDDEALPQVTLPPSLTVKHAFSKTSQ